MRPSGLPIFIALVAVITACAGGASPTVFIDVNVVPMDQNRVLTGQTVLIDDGRIITVGDNASVTVPEDATRINAQGHYLLPGLAEMHAHVPQGGHYLDRVLGLYLANGITTARGMLGAPAHLKLRSELASGERLGPRLVTSGPSLNGRSVNGAADARRHVQSQHAAGYDFLKLHPGLSREEFNAIAETANKLGIPFAGHVSVEVGAARTLDAGQDSIDHLDGYMQVLASDGVAIEELDQGFFGVGLAAYVDEAKITDFAKRTAAAGVWNVPTQTLFENFASAETAEALGTRPEMRYMPKSTVENWRRRKSDFVENDRIDAKVATRAIEIRRRLIKALHDHGAGLLLGSDAPQVFNVPGFSAHRELEILVASGLTPYEALCTGTVNPARYFGVAKNRGQVVVGQAADLILLKNNPLSDISNTRSIAGVMIAGRWHNRAALDALLESFREQDGAVPSN